jgi:hypothetical protein
MSKGFDFDSVTVYKFWLSVIIFDVMLGVFGGSDCLKRPVFMRYLRGTSAGIAFTKFVLKINWLISGYWYRLFYQGAFQV